MSSLLLIGCQVFSARNQADQTLINSLECVVDSLSRSRHTSGGLSQMTLLRFSSPHPVYLLPPSKWSSVCVREVGGGGGGDFGCSHLGSGGTDAQRGPQSFHRSSLGCCVRTEPTCPADSAFSSLSGSCCRFLKPGGRCPNSPTRSCALTRNAAVSTACATPPLSS